MKNFVKTVDKDGAAFRHLCTMFPALSSFKLKEGIFVRLQIQEVLKVEVFKEKLTLKEVRTWETSKSVCHGFLGNSWALDDQEHIKKLLQAYEDMRCRMLLKTPFLHSHLNFGNFFGKCLPRSTVFIFFLMTYLDQ